MIPQIKEINLPSYATLSSATVNLADMADNTITAEVKIDGGIAPDFSYDWEVEFRGERYVHSLRKPQASKDNTTVNSVCSLTFKQKAVVELQRFYFFTYAATNSGTAVADQYIAPLTLNLKNFCIAFNEVLDYYFHGSITIELNPDWVYDIEPKTMEISYSYLWDVLIQLYELYGVRWRIVTVGNKYVIKVGYPTEELDHIFKYGFEGGLLKIERQVQDDNIRNILLGRGGEKNLPAYYFKDNTTDTTFPSDPDWIPELANIYFGNLRDINFRDYVKGWKTNPRRDLMNGKLELEAYDADYAADHFAYELGATDEFFRPVEYVKDDDSIAQYGELWGALDNNEDIYPTIQGVTVDPIGRVDEVIAVQPIESDDVEEAVESEAQLSDLPEESTTVYAESAKRVQFTISGSQFVVPEGLHGTLEITPQVKRVYNRKSGKWLSGDKVAGLALVENYTIKVFDKNTNSEVFLTNIPSGTYRYIVSGTVVNNDSEALNITVGISNGKVVSSDKGQTWGNTFDIWIKNIWLTSKQPGETDQQYVNRVWTPILGGRDGEEAKVVFSTGWLSTSEDYEFTIVKGGVHFEQKECKWTDGEGVEHSYTSEWRLTLAKSDAEYDATGLYLPNTRINASAGDFFFFIGIELPHQYILWAEERLNAYKRDQLGEVADIKPTWSVDLDKIRIAREKIDPNEVVFLIEQIAPGASFKLADSRFITDKAYETVYVQSMTFDFKEPTENDPALIPDVSVVLSNQWANTASMVSTLQGSIDALAKQVGSLSNIEQLIRVIGDKLYLRKDGITDLSLSPTQFASLVTSLGFRQGILGGQGWGFFKDEQGNWSLEVDRLNVRQQMQVNELVINQISARGGMYVESAANMEITNVVNTTDGYVCYFDQKGGTISNLFKVGDVALCHRFTAENGELKFYKRRVMAVGVDHVVLSESIKNGDGVPAEGDVIVQYGSYTDPARRYVKVRDVIGGGYERYIENLDSVNATGTEYYFAGRQSGSYGNNPRFFIGNNQNFVEFINGELNIKAKINTLSTFGDKTLEEALQDNKAPNLMSRYSTDASAWHPNYQSGDVWMQTSNDGGQTWSAAVRITGADYSPNIFPSKYFNLTESGAKLTKAGSLQYQTSSTSRTFRYGFIPAYNPITQSGKFSISMWAKVTSGTAAISADINDHAIIPVTTLSTNWVQLKGTANVTQNIGTLGFLDINLNSGTAANVRFSDVVVTPTDTPLDSWVPTADEMIGTDGSYPHFEWALGTINAPTGAWNGTPQTAQPGLYVWMRQGTVTPPDTTPSTWGTPIRLTGDSGEAYMLDLSNEVAGVACNADGTVTGTLPKSTITVYKGTTLDSGWTFSVAVSGCTASISGSTLSINTLTADNATATVTATKSGCPTLQTTMNLYKVRPGANGTNYTANIFPSTNYNLTDAGARLTKAGSLQFQTTSTSGTYRYKFIPAYCPIRQSGKFSISMWAKVTSGTATIRADINDCVIIPNTTLSTNWVQLKGTVNVTQNIGSHGFMDIECLTNAANVRFSDVVVTPTDTPLDSWVPTADEMIGTDAVVYQLELSANNISRDALGNLSASSITVQKYKTTGASARMLTTEKTVRYQCIGVDSATTTCSAGTSSYNIPVPDSKALTAIIVELMDGTTVLDRERIPVITNGTEVTENLIRNSEANLSTSEYLMRKFQLAEEMVVGQTYTFTIWGTPASGKQYMIFDNLGTVRITNLSQIAEGVYSAVVSIPSGMAEAGRNRKIINVYCYPNNGQTSSLERIKMEKGANYAPVWTESPYDMDYIKSALKESGSIEGGLVLASLMRLGYTKSNGEYVVTAGLNGIAEPQDAIALWAGGEMKDRATSSASDAAKAVIRHDGTAYFAGNTVRMSENTMQVGQNVQLDKNGLSLNIGTNTALQIGDVAVTDSTSVASASYNVPTSLSVASFLYKDLQGEYYPTGTGEAVTVNSTSIAAGAVLRLKGSIKWPLPTVGVYTAANIMLDIILNDKVVKTEYFMLLKNGDFLTYDFDLPPFKLSEAGIVKLRLRFPEPASTWAEEPGNPYTSATATMDRTVSILAYGTGNQTTLGSNGFLAVWDKSMLLCNSSGVTMRCNTYGLRVTSSGIQKLSNGNWVTINL